MKLGMEFLLHETGGKTEDADVLDEVKLDKRSLEKR
jgi:hypothetical protein